ncbi:hypothetical protein HDU90_001844 [Geranomyces variabilis]|nr:hypothetical protein HDU90_001844 [Geranomyces variabilis]
MSGFYDPLAAPKPTVSLPTEVPRTASKGILGQDMEDNVPLAMVAQALAEDQEELLAKAEGLKDGGAGSPISVSTTTTAIHPTTTTTATSASSSPSELPLDPIVPVVELGATGQPELHNIPSMEGLDLGTNPTGTSPEPGHSTTHSASDSASHNAAGSSAAAGTHLSAVPIVSSAAGSERAAEPDDESRSLGNVSTTALPPSESGKSVGDRSDMQTTSNNNSNNGDVSSGTASSSSTTEARQSPTNPEHNIVGGEKIHQTEQERSVTDLPPPPEAESDLAGVETAAGVHPAEAKLQTHASKIPFAFARSEALKEKFKQLESPITGIPGTKENRTKDPTYISGTYRSCERSDKELHSRILPSIAHFLMTLNPYINIAIITGGALGGWMIGNWGWSWVWTAFAGICLALYVSKIRTSMSRAVDFEKKRNEATLKLGENVETAEWLNFFIAQLWPIIDPALFTAAIDTLEDQFVAQAPSFITRINIADFELGPRAPRITSMQVYPGASGEDAVLMDVIVALHPSPQEIASRTRLNTHILINIHLGHPKLGSVAVPIMVEEAGFEAQIRIWLKMTSKAPFVKTLKFTLLNKPQIDFAIRPLKLGNLMNMPLLSQFIMGVIDNTVQDMLVTPKVMALELDRILMGDAALGDTRALGIVKFVFRQAKHLRAADWSGSSDPYATVSFGNASTFLARTRIISRDRNPMWNETHYAVITEDDVKNGFPLSVKVWDYDALSRNEVLGQFEIKTEEVVDSEGVLFDGWKTLLKKNQSEDENKPDVLSRNGKLNLQLAFFPKVDLKDRMEAAKKFKSGIMSIQIHQALDLILRPKDKDGIYPSPYVNVYVNDQLAFKTRIKHDNPSPVWAFTKEFFIRDWSRTIIRYVVKDGRQHEHDPVIGVVVSRLSDVFGNSDDMMVSAWHPLQGGIGFGKLRVSMAFRSVHMEEPENMRGFSIGELEVKDLSIKGLEQITPGAKPPSNIRIRIRSPITEPARAATKQVHPATFSPKWDEKLTLRVNSRYQTALRFEVYQKGVLGVGSKILAVGKMYLQDMVDNKEREVVLGLKRWKGANKKKDDGEEDHLGTTDKRVLMEQHEEGASTTAMQVPQGAEAAKAGLATDISGDSANTVASPTDETSSAATRAETSSGSGQHLLPPAADSSASGSGGRRTSISRSRSSSIGDWSETDSEADDDDARDENGEGDKDSDTASVASFTEDPLAPGADPLTTIHSSPELHFTAVFRPGRSWIEHKNEGEEVEMDEIAHFEEKDQEETGEAHDLSHKEHNHDEEDEEPVDGAASAPRGATKSRKSGLFTRKPAAVVSNHPGGKKSHDGSSGSGQKEDTRLPGNKFSRTLEWSKDTMMDGMKSTRLWKKSSKKSLTLAGQEF